MNCGRMTGNSEVIFKFALMWAKPRYALVLWV
jgi:hypothetical protein